jgi:hypothetical protein
MVMDRDTSFVGTVDDLPTDQEVINAIKSVPTHYGESFPSIDLPRLKYEGIISTPVRGSHWVLFPMTLWTFTCRDNSGFRFGYVSWA